MIFARRLSYAVAVAVALGGACRSVQRPEAIVAKRLKSNRIVPMPVPDSIPTALFDSLGRIEDSGFLFQRDVLVVIFKNESSQAERQTVIDAIYGVVVGGIRWASGLERYLVLVNAPTLQAGAMLSTIALHFPQVSNAHLLALSSGPP